MTVIDSLKVEFAGILLQRHRNSSYTPEGLRIKTKDRLGLVSELTEDVAFAERIAASYAI